MKIDVSILQNWPYSNLVRDDAGAPKEMPFGDATRNRVSSQSIKHAIRISTHFSNAAQVVAIRSRIHSTRIAEMLAGHHGRLPERAEQIALSCMTGLYGGDKKEDKKDDDNVKGIASQFLGSDEISWIVQAIDRNWDELDAIVGQPDKKGEIAPLNRKADAKAVRDLVAIADGGTLAPFVLLGGRMNATQHVQDYTAALHMAHGFSTNPMEVDYDFFTAVDDLNSVGSAHMEHSPFVCPCIYNYCSIDLAQLAENVLRKPDGADARATVVEVVDHFLSGLLELSPKGMSARTAPETAPSLVVVNVRSGGPSTNMCNAFLRAIRPKDDEDLVDLSIKALDSHWGIMKRRFVRRNRGLVGTFVLNATTTELTNLADHEVESDEDLISKTIALAIPEERGGE